MKNCFVLFLFKAVSDIFLKLILKKDFLMTWWWWFGCNSCSSKEKNILQNKQNACELNSYRTSFTLFLHRINPSTINKIIFFFFNNKIGASTRTNPSPDGHLISPANVLSSAQTLALLLQQTGNMTPSPDSNTAAVISKWLDTHLPVSDLFF